MKRHKMIKISLIVFAVVILILLIIRAVRIRSEEKYADITQRHLAVQEVLESLECKFIKKETSTDERCETDYYIEPKYNLREDEIIYETYYTRLIRGVAKANNYISFRIIDDSRKNLITVICNYEEQVIIRKEINGDDNYFATIQSEKSLENYVEIKNTNNIFVQSTELRDLVDNNWEETTYLGQKTQETMEYAIYGQKGIETKIVYRKVFKIIFNKDYKWPIVNGLTTSSSPAEIRRTLGETTLCGTSDAILGYQGENINIFFYPDTNEVIVYRVEKDYETTEFAKLVSQFEKDMNIRNFINELTDIWPDYDYFEYSEGYVEIHYTLKGIKIMFNITNENGVSVYNNYKGYIQDNITLESLTKEKDEIPKYVYLKLDRNLIEEDALAKFVEYDTEHAE